MSAIVDEIADLFADRGRAAYLGERVSIAEHMLQTADAAAQDGASDDLVAAALLHDVGHLLHTMAADSADHGVDTVHEEVGARWLSRAFGDSVTAPIRLHVAAKRYLCAIPGGYSTVLSPASVHSLLLQGGPMTPEEVVAFESLPHSADAVRVRRWDDRGKVAGRDVPSFDHYRPLLEGHLGPTIGES
ncbi:MAG TPA: phosphonate degradation HD-domain oxygenase [Ilumatobacteraceae bacterium]|jgi:phosphonate degradation associated HDIG domain protein